jgi:hypothetical protein
MFVFLPQRSINEAEIFGPGQPKAVLPEALNVTCALWCMRLAGAISLNLKTSPNNRLHAGPIWVPK